MLRRIYTYKFRKESGNLLLSSGRELERVAAELNHGCTSFVSLPEHGGEVIHFVCA